MINADLNPGKRILVPILNYHHRSFCSYPLGVSTKPNRTNSLRGCTLLFHAIAFSFMNLGWLEIFSIVWLCLSAWPFTSAFDPPLLTRWRAASYNHPSKAFYDGQIDA